MIIRKFHYKEGRDIEPRNKIGSQTVKAAHLNPIKSKEDIVTIGKKAKPI